MRFFSTGLCLLFLTVGTLHAHTIWILPSDKGDSARIVWNDPLEADNVDERLDTIAKAEVLLRHADGRVETLKWKQDKDVYRVSCPGTGLRTLVVLWNDDRDFTGGTLRTTVAKAYLPDPAGKAPLPAQELSWDKLSLEIVPRPKRGVDVYQLLSKGQPVAKRVVIPEIPEETWELFSKVEQKELSRRRYPDKDGWFTYPTPKPGLYGLRVPSFMVDEEGEYQGKKFTRRVHFITLVIQVPAAKKD